MQQTLIPAFCLMKFDANNPLFYLFALSLNSLLYGNKNIHILIS